MCGRDAPTKRCKNPGDLKGAPEDRPTEQSECHGNDVAHARQPQSEVPRLDDDSEWGWRM